MVNEHLMFSADTISRHDFVSEKTFSENIIDKFIVNNVDDGDVSENEFIKNNEIFQFVLTKRNELVNIVAYEAVLKVRVLFICNVFI